VRPHVSNVHAWNEDDKPEVDIHGSKKGYVDDYYISQYIFNKDQFLGVPEDFSFNIDI
jgi:hypothetical protein